MDAPSGGAAGDLPLTRLKGVGPKLGTMLESHGLATVAQMASLSDQEIADLDTRLGDFNGRLGRDRVAEQARLLAEGRQSEYSARFGAI
jgi:predicted flap endonuclease-1-like 5' DNA nuclease